MLLTWTENLVDKDGQTVARTFAKRKDLIKYSQNDKWRLTEKKDYADLKADLAEHGDLGPILVNTGKYWGTAGELIGGNTRLRVYTDENIENIWVEPKSPKDEKEFIRLAIIHNRNYSQWNPDALAELTNKFRGDADISRLGVQLSHPVSLDSLHRSYGPAQGATGNQAVQDKAKELDSQAYQNATIKQIVLYFENAEYNSVIKRLDKIAEQTKLESNTDIFLKLLDVYEKQVPNGK